MTTEILPEDVERMALRIITSQRIEPGYFELENDPAPTLRQVAAVIRTLADFTHTQFMVDESMIELGKAKNHDFGTKWQHASGLGRYFHWLADIIQDKAKD
jgi:hypothetical protein